jgi:hypothetical protein
MNDLRRLRKSHAYVELERASRRRDLGASKCYRAFALHWAAIERDVLRRQNRAKARAIRRAALLRQNSDKTVVLGPMTAPLVQLYSVDRSANGSLGDYHESCHGGRTIVGLQLRLNLVGELPYGMDATAFFEVLYARCSLMVRLGTGAGMQTTHALTGDAMRDGWAYVQIRPLRGLFSNTSFELQLRDMPHGDYEVFGLLHLRWSR